jgi:UDP-N-acetylmuramate--alanine ligase
VVARLARPGDLVLTMGAGSVTVLGPEILAELARAESGATAAPDPTAGAQAPR